jgi:hypothetical protein
MGERQRQINIKLSKARRDRWQEAIDEHGYAGWTNLIKQSVERALDEDYEYRRVAEADPTTAEVDLTPLEETLEDIQEEVTRVHKRLDTENEDDIADLAATVITFLPSLEDEDEFSDYLHHLIDSPEVVGMSKEEYARRTGSVANIATVLRRPDIDIMTAGEYLKKHSNISRYGEGADIFYFRDESRE